MRFRFLLWMLAHLLASASRQDSRLRRCLSGRRLVFQLQTRDGRIARHFIVGDLCVHSAGGIYPHADLSVIFCDAPCGSQALRRESRPQAFLEGIQDGAIEYRGNPALILWFQDLLDCLDPQPQPA